MGVDAMAFEDSPDFQPVELQVLTLPLLTSESADGILDSIHLPLRALDKVVGVKMLLDTLTWGDDQDAPAHVPFGDPVPLQRELLMSGVSLIRTKTEDGIISSRSFTRSRFRFLWEVPERAPDQWRYVRMAYAFRDDTVDSEGNLTSSQSAGGSILWEGDVPVGYDPGDPETWPGTVAETVAVPSDPPVAPPEEEGQTTVGFTRRSLVWVLPRADQPLTGSALANVLWAPGLIPGGFSPHGAIQKSRTASGNWYQGFGVGGL